MGRSYGKIPVGFKVGIWVIFFFLMVIPYCNGDFIMMIKSHKQMRLA